MNENAFDALKYMCIHLFIFLFKNFFAKWLLDFSNKGISNKHKNELELLKQKRDKLREEIREVSSTSEYVKFAKMERQINNLNDEIKRRESMNIENNVNNNISEINFHYKFLFV